MNKLLKYLIELDVFVAVVFVFICVCLFVGLFACFCELACKRLDSLLDFLTTQYKKRCI